MRIELDLYAGSESSPYVTAIDIQKNIDAITRTMEGHPNASDSNYMIDTLSILLAIREQVLKQVPEQRPSNREDQFWGA